MKKIILPLILVIFAGGIFLIVKNKNQIRKIEDNPTIIQEKQSGQESVLKGSLKDLLGLGKSLKCSWSVTDEGTTVEGIVYVSGQKTKTETRVKNQEMDTTTYFLTDNNTAYSWSQGQTQGYKFNLEDIDQDSEDQKDDELENDDYAEVWSEQYEYKCQPWQPDASVFELPADINFIDMGEQTKQIQQQAEEMKQEMRIMCDKLPEQQKAECLAGLE